jgi:FKBP-type peptidyl-prolyl cis-trans isomerase FkpA
MRNIVNCSLVLICLILNACSEPGFKKGKGALQYKIVDDHNGPSIGKLATVFLTYTESTGSGKVLSKTGQFDPQPTKIYATNTKFEGDLQDAFQYLSEGDSAVIKVSLDSIKRINKSTIFSKDTAKYMIYTLRLHKVINQNGKADSMYLSRVSDYDNEIRVKRKTDEPEKIKRYLAYNKLNYKATSNGLLYPADLKTVNNKGKLLYVSYIYSSLDGQIYLTKYEKIRPEQASLLGLKEALLIAPKGEKTKVIIPSQLAYGSIGDNFKMAPYTPLLCEFTILDK